MDYQSLDAFLSKGKAVLSAGPVALIFVEDTVELVSTLRHHLQAGFRAVVTLGIAEYDLPDDLAPLVHRLPLVLSGPESVAEAVNRVIARCPPGTWLYYGFNAEYLFYPFSESRSVGELLAFHAEERRDAMLCYVIDLYAPDLERHPNAVSLDEAMLDRVGYYAQARPDPENHNHPKERQLDFFGGLRWRHEEHVPETRRKIDRIALFRTRRGLRLRPDHTFNIEEYNTYSCAWHHNLTAAVMSFRAAKALKSNPGSRYEIATFRWPNSVPFEWNSQQLMDLGLIEPGQWF